MRNDHPVYDAIGSSYDEYSRTATFKRGECHSFDRQIGRLAGEGVLDLACGLGFYSRRLKELGAGRVVGVDVSPEMVRIAEEHERASPLGVTYRVADASDLPRDLGTFDIVTAIWLLNYADTRDALLAMCRAVVAHLVRGGRFLAFTLNPGFDLARSNATKYGIRIVDEIDRGDHVVVHGEFVTNPPRAVTVYRWSRDAYESTLAAAGFTSAVWVPWEVSPEDLREYGADYWRDFLDNCTGIGIDCRTKPGGISTLA
jgi:SAM-dependent methyltransferase